ncbi:MAG: helix-turn-helix domain-containing protein [Spongiibacteraceae bacterium]
MSNVSLKMPTPLPKGAIQLLLTAERLFGEQGLDGVSLRQIVTASGQANSSAVQHHFGSKEGLIQAVYDMRLPELDQRRMQLLLQFKDTNGDIPLAQLLRAMFWPVVNDMDEAAQKSFALFNAQLMLMDIDRHPYSHTKVPQPAYLEIDKRFKQILNYLPVGVLQLRLRLATDMFFGALNERGRLNSTEPNLYPSQVPYWNEVFLAIEALLRLPYTDNI